MKIVFLTRLFYPHIGGVEKHVQKVTEELTKNGHDVSIITTRYGRLKANKSKDGYRILRFRQPKIPLFGLLYTWFWVLLNHRLFQKADIVHAHDVTIWLLPLKIISPKKPIYTTMHGWEGKYPIPLKNKLLKKLSRRMSKKVIGVGEYIGKYYQVKLDRVVYGATDRHKWPKKKEKRIIFVGRLDRDTGVEEFVRLLPKHKGYEVEFFGDGPLREFCEAFGVVHGFVDTKSAMEKAEIVFAGGYLTALEALSWGCKVFVSWDNELKRDYWKTAPFFEYLEKPELFRKQLPDYSWKRLAKQYVRLWEK